MIRNFYAEKCTGCGTCVKCCPMDVLRIDEDTKKLLRASRYTCGPDGS